MKKYILIIVLFIFSLTFVLPVLALENSTSGEEFTPKELKEVQTQRKSVSEDLKIKLREQRCERVTERVDNRINGFNKNKEKHVVKYTNLQKRANKIITELKKLKFDVTVLENDMKTYDSLVKDFLAKYNKFVDSVKGAKLIACDDKDNSNGFKTQVEVSRNYLKDTRESAKAIHVFVKNTLKPHFMEMKSQIKETKLENNNDEK